MLRKINAFILLVSGILYIVTFATFPFSKPTDITVPSATFPSSNPTNIIVPSALPNSQQLQSKLDKQVSDFNLFYYSLPITGTFYLVIGIFTFLISRKSTMYVFDFIIVFLSIFLLATYANISINYPLTSSFPFNYDILGNVTGFMNGYQKVPTSSDAFPSALMEFFTPATPAFEILMLAIIPSFFIARKYL